MLLKQMLFLLLSLCLLSGCVDGFKGYFKRSANNKLIDTKGFEGGKRKPLYNKKYIALAKKNIVDDNLDEDNFDDEDPIENPPKASSLNKQIYVDMLKQDAKNANNRERLKKYKGQYNSEDSIEDSSYPSISKANKKAKLDQSGDNDLKKELEEIKSMLSETKRELTKHKCPMQSPLTGIADKKSKLKEKFIDSDESHIMNPKSKLKQELDKLPPPNSI